ncbi:Carboxypeptidase regulatory-like domain protein [uncultured archaeon]|nr:Carboxypeptidase regulatory-like domain protein [uncultured archaeon]
MIQRKIIVYGVLCILLLTSLCTSVASQTDLTWWDKNWSFRQEISLPIFSQLSFAKFQPIDIRVVFENNCWALSENHSSIRVCYWDGNEWSVLESQIYDLNFVDKSSIKACSLVFLIPKNATGKEVYYIYYNDKETSPANYPDHVQVEKTHYYYEPIPGQKADFDYYKITDEGYCIYGVGLQGMMMTEYGTQMIFRQSKGQKDFSYRYWDRLASFCFQYRDASLPVGQDTITTRMKLLSNEIFVDGNLMVQFGIMSTNSRESAKTTDIYKYYYSPMDIKRICVQVKHEVLKDITVASVEKVDGEYAFTSGFKTRSEANTFLNTGEILPYIHYFDIDGTIQEIKSDTNPTSTEEEWLVSVEDNADLGSYPWVSADNGETGKAHALIFSSTNVVKSGTDEQDGIQIKASQKQEVNIPGLQAYSSGMGCFRNAYNSDGSVDRSIPSGLLVEFDGEFFTTEINSYKDVQNETIIFQSLVKYRPLQNGSVSVTEKEEKKYTLTVFTHAALSFPLGSLISAASGKNFSYTYAELYHNGNLISSGVCSRLSLVGEFNLDLKNISIRSILKLFNWSDISFYKKVRFPQLVPGTYVIKIYIKSGEKSNYVGVKPIVLQGDTKVDVACSEQQKMSISVTDQNNQSVLNCRCVLSIGNVSVEENNTDIKGNSVIIAPRGVYDFKLLYNGFNLFEKIFRLGIFHNKEHFQADLFDLQLFVKDKFGLPPGIPITPIATSEEMEISTKILPQEIKPGSYQFTNLPEAQYKIQISYKTFLDEITVQIPNVDKSVEMEFTPMFQLTATVFDSRGSTLSNMAIDVTREGKSVQKTTDVNGIVSFFIPVGNYLIQATSDGKSIGEKHIDVLRNETAELMTMIEPVYPLIMIIVALLLTGGGIILFFLKKCSLASFLKLCGVSLCIVAVIMPWWNLSGVATTPVANRSTNAYLTTQTIVTTTTVGTSTELERANIPAEFSLFLLAVLLLVIITCCIILGSIVIHKHKKLAFGLTVLGIVFLVCSVGIFTYGFSELSKVGLGSLQGSGAIMVLQPQSNEYVNLSATWGLSTGVYLTIVAIILVVISIVIKRISKRKTII